MQPNPTPATRDEVRKLVRRIFVEEMGHDSRTLSNKTRIADLDLDGVGPLELMMAVEDMFDLEIPEGDFDTFATLQDIVDYIARRLGL